MQWSWNNGEVGNGEVLSGAVCHGISFHLYCLNCIFMTEQFVLLKWRTESVALQKWYYSWSILKLLKKPIYLIALPHLSHLCLAASLCPGWWLEHHMSSIGYVSAPVPPVSHQSTTRSTQQQGDNDKRAPYMRSPYIMHFIAKGWKKKIKHNYSQVHTWIYSLCYH